MQQINNLLYLSLSLSHTHKYGKSHIYTSSTFLSIRDCVEKIRRCLSDKLSPPCFEGVSGLMSKKHYSSRSLSNKCSPC